MRKVFSPKFCAILLIFFSPTILYQHTHTLLTIIDSTWLVVCYTKDVPLELKKFWDIFVILSMALGHLFNIFLYFMINSDCGSNLIFGH